MIVTDAEYAKKQAELLKEIPVEFHGPLSYLAYERGHAYGHDEVYSELQDLVYGLRDAIRAFEDRIRVDLVRASQGYGDVQRPEE